MAKNRDLYNDKVEISVVALIEIKRAFSALIDDKESYVHKVFMDDYIHRALKELKDVYAEYFEEEVENWVVSQRNEQIICPCCGSDKTYYTNAIYCTICAVTTEI